MSDEKYPVVELWPWEARAGVARRTVWVPVGGRPRPVPIRVKPGVRDGTLLRLPGDVHLRVRVTVKPIVYRVLAGVVLVAGLVFGVLPSTLLLGAVWALLEFCRSRRPRTTGFRRQLCVFGVLYLVPIGVAAACQAVLGVAVAARRDALDVDALRSLERTLAGASGFFSANLKLDELKVLGLLVLVYVLTAVIANARASKVLHGATDLYTRFSGPVAAGLAVLAAFTFFGTHLGTQARVVAQHVKTTEVDYRTAALDLEEELASRIASDLAAKVLAEMPAEYRDLFPTPVFVGASGQLSGQDAEPRRAMPGTTTPRDVVDVREALDRVEPTTSTPAEKKIFLQVEKLLTEKLLEVAKKATDQVPLLDPFVQAFVEAVDKHLQDGVLSAAYDRVMDAVWRNPGDLDAVVREATGLVSGTDVSAPVAAVADRTTRWTRIGRLLADLGDDGRWSDAQATLQDMDLSEAELRAVEHAMAPPDHSGPPTLVQQRTAEVISHGTSPHRTDALITKAKKICGCP
ncbi:hypothetical protein [Saccharothrix syringae]|uniref:Uncharacterized protein n=1 Tax=Saccharothrix syringae TaxID=103733 RepID=A0A5Q0GWF1_SACSY|nr:hypothetical protein [Saccharothrix syringae]QFZ18278.1 hypothetical protein EKG83_12995 [Saccharothrix syringae]